MKSKFFPVLVAGVLTLGMFSLYGAETPEAAVRQFFQGFVADFTKIREAVTADSLPHVDEMERVARKQLSDNKFRIQVLGDRALVECDMYPKMKVRRVNGDWKVDLAGSDYEYSQLIPDAACVSNLKQLGLGLLMYMNDNQDKMPKETGAAGLKELKDYVGLPVFICPADKKRKPAGSMETFTEKNTSYFLFDGKFKEKYPSRIPGMVEKPGIHENVIHVLFMDGHVEKLEGKFASVKEIMAALAKKITYTEEQLAHLNKQAEEADRVIAAE